MLYAHEGANSIDILGDHVALLMYGLEISQSIAVEAYTIGPHKYFVQVAPWAAYISRHLHHFGSGGDSIRRT